MKIWIKAIAMSVAAASVAATVVAGDQVTLPTTAEDFYQPGQQPLPSNPNTDPPTPMDEFQVASFTCQNCHLFDDDNNPDIETGPMNNWAASMMAQSARDPVWQAALTISNQDASMSGEYCIRCHAPTTWASGRSTSGTLDDFIDPDDFDGVNCNFCHRMVDPTASEENPDEDDLILQALIDEGNYPDPNSPGNGRFIFDPDDTRRGPLDDIVVNMHGAAQILVSPHHLESSQCASCHDLSNPVFEVQSDGTYALTDYDMAHPTQNTYEMMPEQRTYSEWLASTFADTGVQFDDGRFGGDHPTGIMKSCQDCHMPKASGANCAFWYIPDVGDRESLSLHQFHGGNTWVLGAVHSLYDPAYTGLTDERVADALDRTIALLKAASDLEVTQDGTLVTARVTNWSGHKLPTGFPEGRRMWINAQFFDESDSMISEVGAYDYTTADLDTTNTKVYEAKLGMDETVATLANLPAGETFHLVLANQILKDNRIPPVGFTNSEFDAIQASPVNYSYADGQHWDDTTLSIPKGAKKVVVTLFFQTSSKEYMEFLRDANVTDDKGQIAYDAWVAGGKSAPVVMDSMQIDLQLPEGDGDYCTTPMYAEIGANSFETTTAVDSGFGEPDENQCPGTKLSWSNSPDRWFIWQPTGNGLVNFDTCDPLSYDTSLVIYQGDDCGSLVQIACNGDSTEQTGCQSYYSGIYDLPVTGGETYFVRIGGWLADTGEGTLNITFEPEAIPGDLDGDGDVDVNDILLLLADFGCTGTCQGDVDGNGEVNVSDILILLANWTTP
ncbi:MAG: hypothetical protein CMJ39_12490 [Phycisphaerae bacterium]|nr:hypothetical protein [Phycisphaerae bacterium]